MSVDRTHWRLRRRVFGSILLAGLAVAPFLLMAIWAGATSVEDTILEHLVRLEADRLVSAATVIDGDAFTVVDGRQSWR